MNINLDRPYFTLKLSEIFISELAYDLRNYNREEDRRVSPAEKRIKLLHYNDIHSNLEFEASADVCPQAGTSTAEEEEGTISDITSPDTHSDFSSKYLIFSNLDCCFHIEKETQEFLISMDQLSQLCRNSFMLDRHPQIYEYHRAQLFDWIVEICDFFSVTRDTYYLVIDYFDRFLAMSVNLSLRKMPLVGIASLYIASKLEEVHPIPLSDLIFVTDEVFTQQTVLDMEKEILQVISWRCSMWTANRWLLMFIHFTKYNLTPWEYIKVTDLLDMVMMDKESLNFSYSVLAAASFYHVTAINATFPFDNPAQQLNICECALWMKTYWDVIKKLPLAKSMQKYLKSYEHKCKLLNYSLSQRYNNFFDVYKNIKQNTN